MAILDRTNEERVELHMIPDNTEKRLRVRKADFTPQKNNPNRSNLVIDFEDPDDQLVGNIRVWLTWPDKSLHEEDPRNYLFAQQRLDSFLEAFGVPARGTFTTDDLLAREGWCLVSEETGNDGVTRNSVRRYLPKR
jgi:hypothetical protein